MVASRVTHAVKTIGIERVAVHGSFAPNGSSALVAANTYGKGFSVARTSTGLFTVTMDNAYPALISGQVTVQRPNSNLPTIAQLGTYVAASKTIGINTFLPNTSGFVPISLATVREDDGSVDIPAVSDTPLTDDPDGFGGILAKNTTPILEYINTSTDRAHRLNWAATVVDKVSFQVPLPPNLSSSSGMTVNVRAAMGGATDTGSIGINTHFNEGDTAVADSIAGISGTSYAEHTATIGLADIPAGAQTMTVEMTPGAHNNDALYVSAIWIEFTATNYNNFALSDLTANANTRIHFNLWFRNTSVDY